MPLSRRQVYRRRRIAVGTLAALVLGTGFYLPLTLLAPVQVIQAQVEPPAEVVPSPPPVTFPAYGASGVGALGYPVCSPARGRPRRCRSPRSPR